LCNFQAAVLADAAIPGEPGHDQLWRPEAIAEEELLARAKHRLDHMEFVGIAERFDESVDVLCHVFDWNLALRAAPENANPEPELSDKGRKLLVARNRVDYALYAYAQQRFSEQLAAMHAHQEAHPAVWQQRSQQRIAYLQEMAARQAALL